MATKKLGFIVALVAFSGLAQAETINIVSGGESVATVVVPAGSKVTVQAQKLTVSKDGTSATYVGNVSVKADVNGAVVALSGSEAIVIK